MLVGIEEAVVASGSTLQSEDSQTSASTQQPAVEQPTTAAVVPTSSQSSSSLNNTSNTSLSGLTQMRIPSIAELMSQKKVLDLIPGLPPTSSQAGLPHHPMNYPMSSLAVSMGLTHNFPLHLNPQLQHLPTLQPLSASAANAANHAAAMATNPGYANMFFTQQSLSANAKGGKSKAKPNNSSIHKRSKARIALASAAVNSSLAFAASQILSQNQKLITKENAAKGSPEPLDDNASTTSAASSATTRSKDSLSFPSPAKPSVDEGSTATTVTAASNVAVSSSAAEKVIVSKYMNYSLLQQQQAKPAATMSATATANVNNNTAASTAGTTSSSAASPYNNSSNNSNSSTTTGSPIKVSSMMSGPANLASIQAMRATPMASSLKYPVMASTTTTATTSAMSSSATENSSGGSNPSNAAKLSIAATMSAPPSGSPQSNANGVTTTTTTTTTTAAAVRESRQSPLKRQTERESARTNLASSVQDSAAKSAQEQEKDPHGPAAAVPAAPVVTAAADAGPDQNSTLQVIEEEEENDLADLSACFTYEEDDLPDPDSIAVHIAAVPPITIEASCNSSNQNNNSSNISSVSESDNDRKKRSVSEASSSSASSASSVPAPKKSKKSASTTTTNGNASVVPAVSVAAEGDSAAANHNKLQQHARITERMTYLRPTFQHFLDLLPNSSNNNNNNNNKEEERLCRHFMQRFFQRLTQQLHLGLHQHFTAQLATHAFYHTPAIFDTYSCHSAALQKQQQCKAAKDKTTTKKRRTLSLPSDMDPTTSPTSNNNKGCPPCQDIAIYYALKAAIEYYQTHSSRLMQLCVATINQDASCPHVTINTSTGELTPFLSKRYMERLLAIAVNDLEDFTYSRRFIGYLSHLLPPTILQQQSPAKPAVQQQQNAAGNAAVAEEEEEDAQYKRCFEQVLQHLIQLVPASPAIDYSPYIAAVASPQPVESVPMMQSNTAPSSSNAAPSQPQEQAVSVPPVSAGSSAAVNCPQQSLSSEEALTIREVASFYFQDNAYQHDEMDDDEEDEEEDFDERGFEMDVLQVLASFS